MRASEDDTHEGTCAFHSFIHSAEVHSVTIEWEAGERPAGH